MKHKSINKRLSTLEIRNHRKEKRKVHIYDPTEGLDTYLAGLPDTDETIILLPDNGRNLTRETHT